MRVRGADLAGSAFTAAVLCAADPSRDVVATPYSWTVVTAGTLAVLAVAAWQRTIVLPARLVGGLYLGFLAWMALAAAAGEDGRFAWLGIPQRHAGWALWLLCGALFVSGVRWKAVVDGMVVAGLVWLPVLLADAFGHPLVTSGSDRLTGTFGSSAYLGAAACLVAPATLGVAMDTRRRPRWRIVATVAAASATFGAAGSGSRAAWLGLAAVGGWAAWHHRRRRVLPLATGIALAVVALAALTTPVLDRASSTTDPSAAGGASRVDEWRVGVATLSHHALLGAGPEGYRIVFRDGVDAEYEREHGRAVQPDRAHNGVLDVALTGGVPAALLLVGFMVAAAMDLRRRMRGTPASPALRGALAGIIAYLAQQQFLFPLAEVEPVLFLLAGGVVSSGRAPLRMRAAGGRLAGCLCIVLAGAALWWGVRDVAAWQEAAAAGTAAASDDLSAARKHALRALDWRDDEVWLHLLLSHVAASPEDALAAADDALALSPGDPIALTRREELLVTMDPGLAFEELGDLLQRDPHNAILQQLYGTAAARTGDEEIAERAWLSALDLAPDASGPRQNLITLYRQQGRDAEADALENGGNR